VPSQQSGGINWAAISDALSGWGSLSPYGTGGGQDYNPPVEPIWIPSPAPPAAPAPTASPEAPPQAPAPPPQSGPEPVFIPQADTPGPGAVPPLSDQGPFWGLAGGVVSAGYQFGKKLKAKLKKQPLPAWAAVFTARTSQLEDLFARSGIGKQLQMKPPTFKVVAEGVSQLARGSVLATGLLFPSALANSDLYGGIYDPRLRKPAKSPLARQSARGNVSARNARPAARSARPAEPAQSIGGGLEPIVIASRTAPVVATPAAPAVSKPGRSPYAPAAPAPSPTKSPVKAPAKLPAWADFAIAHQGDLLALITALRAKRLSRVTAGVSQLAIGSIVPSPLIPPIPGTYIGPLTSPQGLGLPSTPSDRCNCQQTKRKPRKARAVCYKGSYTESRYGLSKQKREEIPCQ